jgi:hypothetical protein
MVNTQPTNALSGIKRSPPNAQTALLPIVINEVLPVDEVNAQPFAVPSPSSNSPVSLPHDTSAMSPLNTVFTIYLASCDCFQNFAECDDFRLECVSEKPLATVRQVGSGLEDYPVKIVPIALSELMDDAPNLISQLAESITTLGCTNVDGEVDVNIYEVKEQFGLRFVVSGFKNTDDVLVLKTGALSLSSIKNGDVLN